MPEAQSQPRVRLGSLSACQSAAGRTQGSRPELGHRSRARDTAGHSLTAAVKHGHNGGATVQKLKHFLRHPTTHLAPLALTVIGKTRQFYYQPDPRLVSHISVITLYICPWQLYILAPSDANPVSLFSCLIPRQ